MGVVPLVQHRESAYGIQKQTLTDAIYAILGPIDITRRVQKGVASYNCNTITQDATFAITGAPITGTNATTTNAFSILIGTSTSASFLNASTTNSYGLGVFANGGATNNYAAELMGGNVGVGTSSPFQTLSVSGNAFFTGSATTTSLAVLASSTISGAFNAPGAVTLGNATTTGSLYVTASTTLAGALNSVFSNLLASTTLLGSTLLTNATTTNLFATVASTTNLFTTTGNITTLTLTGTVSCSSSQALTTNSSGLVACGTITAAASPGGSNGQLQYNNNGSQGGLSFFVASSSPGVLGVGTSTPQWLLELATSTAPQLALSDAIAADNHWTFRNAGGFLYIATSSPSTFATSSVTALTIDKNGNVGIGTSTPGSLLSVGGVANFTTATSTFYSTTGGININGGCFAINGACIGMITKLSYIYSTSTPGTVTAQFTGAQNSAPSFTPGVTGTLTLQSNIAYYTVEGWGGGGGGGATITNNGGAGASTCYSQNATACSATALINAGGGGGGTLGDAAGAGGAGGTASVAGAFNINGQAGATGVALVANSPGGGKSPKGGSGGLIPTAASLAGNAGGSPGGGGSGASGATGSAGSGGGGAYSQNVASTSVLTTSTFVVGAGDPGGAAGTNAGGAGAPGAIVITLYATSSPSGAGNDYAEMYPVTNPLTGAGDIVAVDSGIPISMKLAEAGDTAPLAGVVSTAPGQLLGDQQASGQRPIALSGRVPAKVNLEGGPIAIGDRIAPSSVPGVGKKAGPFDDSVGIAIENYDGTLGTKTVIVFINLQRGIDVNALGARLLGNGASTTASSTVSNANPFDFVGGMMHAISSRLAAIVGFAVLSPGTTTAATTTSTALPGDIFASNLWHGLLNMLTAWFGSISNGIGDFFAHSVHTREVCVSDDTGSSTCITKAQLDDLLSGKGRSTSILIAASSTPLPSSIAGAPILYVNGSNPAALNVGDAYIDLGAKIIAPAADVNLGVYASVDGGATTTQDRVAIGTNAPRTHTIIYSATDQQGQTGYARRTVIVSAPGTTSSVSVVPPLIPSTPITTATTSSLASSSTNITTPPASSTTSSTAAGSSVVTSASNITAATTTGTSTTARAAAVKADI